MTNTIVPYNVSTNIQLSNRLLQLDDQFERAAAQDLAQALEGNPDAYTQAEKRAIIKFQKLKLIGNLGLTEILLRGRALDEIEAEGLWTIIPGNHQRLEDAAKSVGVGTSTLSFIKDLTRIVFPYMVGTMGVDLALVWEEIGSSNFRELLPVMKTLITGIASDSPAVNQAAQRELDDITASGLVTGQAWAPEEVVRMAVDHLREVGQLLPNREVRTHLRPERTPSVHAIVVQSGNRRYVISEVDDDQWTMFQRKMSGYMDTTPIQPEDLARVPLYRTLRTLESAR